MTLLQQYAFSWLSASTIYLIQYRKFNDNVLRGLQVVQSSSNSLNKCRFDSESILWSWIGLIHAAHCSGIQCESIFNQTMYSVAYNSSPKRSYRCMFFKEVKLTVRCQIIVNKIA